MDEVWVLIDDLSEIPEVVGVYATEEAANDAKVEMFEGDVRYQAFALVRCWPVQGGDGGG